MDHDVLVWSGASLEHACMVFIIMDTVYTVIILGSVGM